MKEVTTSELKTQLNRMESKLSRIIDLVDPNFYEPSQAEINDIKEFAEKVNNDWFERYPYEKYTHTGSSKWEPITEGMRVRALAAARRLKEVLSEKDIEFLKDTVGNQDNATDLTEGQVRKLNALLYQLYKK